MNLLKVLLTLCTFIAFSVSASTSTPKVKFNEKGWAKHKGDIIYASKTVGVNPVSMTAYASIETRMGLGMVNQTSGTEGLFQFTNRTWRAMVLKHGKKHGITLATSKFDHRANSLMAAELANDNRLYLEKRLKRKVNSSEVYMAHLLGHGAAEKILRAPNNRIAANVTPPRGNKYFFYDNGRAITVGEFKRNMSMYVETHASVYRESVHSQVLRSTSDYKRTRT